MLISDYLSFNIGHFELTGFIVDYWSDLCEVNICNETNSSLQVNLSISSEESMYLYEYDNYLNIFSLSIPKELRGKKYFKNFIMDLENQCKREHYKGIKALSVINPTLEKGLVNNGYKTYKDRSYIGTCCIKEFKY